MCLRYMLSAEDGKSSFWDGTNESKVICVPFVIQTSYKKPNILEHILNE